MWSSFRVWLTTATLAFVYAFLLSAGIGIVLIVFGIQLDQRWGLKIPVTLFVLLLWPSHRVARAWAKERERIGF